MEIEGEHFENNLEIWGRSHPKEALLLPYLDTSGLSICKTDKGELNLCRVSEGKKEFYHSSEGAMDEANEWFSKIDSNHVGVLYVYGIGLGYYYEAAKNWLHEDGGRFIAFLEDDLAVLKKFFETKQATEILEDPQVLIVYIQDLTSKKEMLGSLFWKVALSKAQVSALNYYKVAKQNIYLSLCHEIAYGSELKKALIDEYLQFGSAYFFNCYRNISYLYESYIGSKLYGKFQNVPAIICGAGPSLEKNMHLLKQLRERALIFAGGSAINILNSASIQPHFCAAIDPNEAQNVRLSNAQAYEVPFFYRNRLGHSAFKTIHGPRLFLTGSGGYDISEYFESKLDLESDDLDEGRNVINFMMEIAKKLGCNPIIFVGTDLAFTDRKTYSEGVVFDPKVEQETLDIYANFESTGLVKKDIYGNPIYTLWKWIAEAEWIGDWAKENPQLKLYNCTEGGLGFPNVQNLPLKKLSEESLKDQFDLQGRIHAEIQNSRSAFITKERVFDALEELKESLVRCQENIETLISETQQMSKKIEENPEGPLPQQSGLAALAETDLAEEVAFPAVIAIFNEVFSSLLTPELQKIKYMEATEQEKQLMRNQLILSRLDFLQNVAKINVTLIDFAFESFEKNKHYEKPEKEIANPYRAQDKIEKLNWKDKSVQHEKVLRLYYDSGAIKGESTYHEGLLDGPSQFYTEDGKLLSNATFKNGKQEGECLWYYPSGAIYSKQNFRNDFWEGDQIFYYENGQVKTQFHCKAGSLQGIALLYNDQGLPKRMIDFD